MTQAAGAATTLPRSAGGPTRELPLTHLITLSIYWLGITTIWGGLDGVVIPRRLDEMDPLFAGRLQAIINAVGVMAPILVQPTIGVISDHTISRWGRRKPYILIGTVLDVVILLAFATSNTFLAMVAFYFLLQVSSNFAQGPFQGYVPDLVPARQVGMASGFMGSMIVLGRIVGTGVATIGLTVFDSFFIATIGLGVVEAVTMVVLVSTIDEGTAAPPRRQSWLRVALSAWGTDLLKERSVLWLLAVRALFLGAVAAPLSYAFFYFLRSHDMTANEATTMVFIGTGIVGLSTLVATIPAARLSDRVGRRPVIWVATAIGAVGITGVAVAPSAELGIALLIPFGVATGAFLSVDWALMTDVIPKHASGRYMGILNVGTAIAGPLFLAFGGTTMDLVGSTVGFEYGPRAALLLALVWLAGAALALIPVDPRRRERDPETVDPSSAALE
ncbi:MAG TPA: MFS transporter [Candidatus Limnocylindrales bacterium]|nr:MFS transporter [Candidatus Limnocylindrales bacterium]